MIDDKDKCRIYTIIEFRYLTILEPYLMTSREQVNSIVDEHRCAVLRHVECTSVEESRSSSTIDR